MKNFGFTVCIVSGLLLFSVGTAWFISPKEFVSMPNGDNIQRSLIQAVTSQELNSIRGYGVIVVWDGIHTTVHEGLTQQQARESVQKIMVDVESKLP